jgi:methionyl-tRNA formyltransferase
MKIVFFWTAWFSANILEWLIEDDCIEVDFVVSQEDKPVGRKKILEETAVKKIAKSLGIKVLQPLRLKEDTSIWEISKDIDFFVVVAYGKIIPQHILDIPKYGCINLHGSILPKYRWASPVQESLKNGDMKTWLTTMYMSAWMDEGDILEIEEVTIENNDTQVDIFGKFELIWSRLIVSTLKKIEEKSIVAKKQDDALATYCLKISKLDWKVIFTKESSSDIYNKFRAYTPWPWIFSFFKKKKFAIIECYVDDEWNTWNIWEGVKIWKKIWIVCLDKQILFIEKIKLEWKGTMDILDFINGNPDFIWYKFLDV